MSKRHIPLEIYDSKLFIRCFFKHAVGTSTVGVGFIRLVLPAKVVDPTISRKVQNSKESLCFSTESMSRLLTYYHKNFGFVKYFARSLNFPFAGRNSSETCGSCATLCASETYHLLFSCGTSKLSRVRLSTTVAPGGGLIENRDSGIGSLIWMFVNWIVVVVASIFVLVFISITV